MKKQETVPDIVRWLRSKPVVFGFRETNALADRIEAAWKRDAAIHAMTCEANERLREHLEIAIENNKRIVGNAAAMIEALKAVVAVGYPHNFQREAPHIRGYCYDITKAIGKCFAALSAPPRNCDRFMSIEQAWTAYSSECGRIISIWDGYEAGRFEEWLFSPTIEQKGDNDGSK
jgi:hypothetical protein